jgi:hypothetical protein
MSLKIFLLLFMINCKTHSLDFGVEYWQMRQRLLDKILILGNCPTSFLQEHCGGDCTINQELPYVYQHSEDVLDCQLFYSPIQQGTVSLPFIRSRLETMNMNQSIGPKTMNISTNIGPTLFNSNTEQITYIPSEIYHAVGGYDFSPSWDPNDDVYIDFNYFPDFQYVYHDRVSNPETTFNYNIIDYSLKNNEIVFIIEQSESFKVCPNPFESDINLFYYASAEKNCTLKLLDVLGKIVVNENYCLAFKGRNEITITLSKLSNDIDNLIV